MRKVFFLVLVNLQFYSIYLAHDSINYILYYQIRNEAMFYFYEQDFVKSNEYFEKALNLNLEPFDFDMYCFAASLCETDQQERGYQLLKTNPYSNRILIDSSYFNCFSQSEKTILKYRGDSITKVINDLINQSQIFKDFENYSIYDQKYRSYISEKIRPNSLISEEEKQIQIDSIFTLFFIEFDKMDSILRSEGGFVGLSPHDLDWGQVFTSLFLIHSGDEYYNKNEDYLLDQIALGRLTPFLYASAKDRFFYFNKGFPEYYESYVKKIDPQLDPKIRFDRLNSIGISPYHERTMGLKPKGKIPKSRCYDEYKTEKEYYNCISK